MGGAFGDRRRGQLVGVLGEKLGLRQVGGVRHAPPPPHGRPAALALSTRVHGASQPRCHQPSCPGGCRRLPGDFFGPASCPSRARCGPSVAGKPSRTHGEPPGGTVAGLTMRGPGLQAGEEDLPGKVPGEFSSPSVCRPAWKMLRWGESRGRTSQQPVWLILPAPRAFALSVPSAWGVLPLPSSPRWRLCILPRSA